MCRILLATTAVVLFATILIGCGKPEKAQTHPRATAAALGTAENPIKMALVPSLDTRKLIASGEKLAVLLEKQTDSSMR